MSITQNNGVCPALLISYNEAVTKQQQQSIVTRTGFMGALLDEGNRVPITLVQTVGAEMGHPKTVRIKFKQRQTDADVRTSKSCDAGTQKPYFEQDFVVNGYSEIAIQVAESTIRTLCDTASAIRQAGERRDMNGQAARFQLMEEIWYEIGIDFDALRSAINKELLTSYLTQFGTWVGGDATKTFEVYRNANTSGLNKGSVILDGYTRFIQEATLAGYNGVPYVVGNGSIFLANEALKSGGDSAMGTNFSAVNAYMKFNQDVLAADILGGADEAIVFMPTTLQMARYNEYVGEFARPIGKMERGTIADPVIPGLRYDLRVLPNECEELYDIFIGLHYQLYGAPTDLYATGDRLEGVNGVYSCQFTSVNS
jgi:hypothetical protein